MSPQSSNYSEFAHALHGQLHSQRFNGSYKTDYIGAEKLLFNAMSTSISVSTIIPDILLYEGKRK